MFFNFALSTLSPLPDLGNLGSTFCVNNIIIMKYAWYYNNDYLTGRFVSRAFSP